MLGGEKLRLVYRTKQKHKVRIENLVSSKNKYSSDSIQKNFKNQNLVQYPIQYGCKENAVLENRRRIDNF